MDGVGVASQLREGDLGPVQQDGITGVGVQQTLENRRCFSLVGLGQPHFGFQECNSSLFLGPDRLEGGISLDVGGNLKRPVGHPALVPELAQQEPRVDVPRRQHSNAVEMLGGLAQQLSLRIGQAQVIAEVRFVERAIDGQDLVPVAILAKEVFLGPGWPQRHFPAREPIAVALQVHHGRKVVRV